MAISVKNFLILLYKLNIKKNLIKSYLNGLSKWYKNGPTEIVIPNIANNQIILTKFKVPWILVIVDYYDYISIITFPI
jgi:hypothetical protein